MVANLVLFFEDYSPSFLEPLKSAVDKGDLTVDGSPITPGSVQPGKDAVNILRPLIGYRLAFAGNASSN